MRAIATRAVRTAAIACALSMLPAAAVTTGQEAVRPDRRAPPVPGPPPALVLPPLHAFRLSSGVEVHVAEMPEVPVVDVLFLVNAGASADPPDRPGLASLTAAMLSEGAGGRDAEGIANDIAFLGATLGATTSYDATRLELSVPVSRLDAALAIAADVLMAPTFPDDPLARLRRERQNRLLELQDDPSSLASVMLASVLYGPGHRYGRPILGTHGALEAMTVADVRDFHARHYQPGQTHVIVAGAVEPESTRLALEQAIGRWRNADPGPAPPETPSPAATRTGIYLVDRPGAPQAEIRVGRIGVPRNTPDRFTVDVLNTLLGGSFMSRLNMNLRETHGYAYGAGSYFDMRRAAGPFTVWAAVEAEHAADALREIFRELGDIQNPIPADELARARGFAALGFPAGFETPADLTGRLAELATYGLPDTFFEDYVPGVQQVSAEAIRAAAERYLPDNTFATVVIGDLTVIRQSIEDAALGEVGVIDAAAVLR